MKWIQIDVQSHYDVFECSNCGDAIIVREDALPPCYCKSCGESEEE